MMRFLLQHAKPYRFRTFGTLPSPTKTNQTLQHRITEALDRNAQIIPVLQQWRQQGNQINPSHVRVIIKKLRDSEHSLQALQVSEWMSQEKLQNSNQFSNALQSSEWLGEKGYCNLYSEDYAARLNLIETVLGLEEAEKFFKNIPENMKDYSVYATLLTSYAKSDKKFGKANTTFKKMRELGFLLKPSPFNSMISLYNQEDKVEEILREMKENNVDPDSLTVNNVLKTYAAESKVESMERFMNVWMRGDKIKLERDTMLAMAKAYAKSGSTKKAIEMYGNVAGSKREVYSLWNEFKKNKKLEDEGLLSSSVKVDVDDASNKEEKLDDEVYRTVIRSLLKLDDVEGAEKVYGEWKPDGPKLDLSIPGLLISRFCAEGKELKVKELMNSIREKRNGMHLRMLRAFAIKVTIKFVEAVAVCVAILIVGFILSPPSLWIILGLFG